MSEPETHTHCTVHAHDHDHGPDHAHSHHKREHGVRAVVLITALMMVVEIVVGMTTHSMALTADGWHMATHVGALGVTSIAYALARRYAEHEAFTFGTGKFHSIAGYTSALVLGAVAVSMLVESVQRLLHAERIDFGAALPVAVLGFVVNLVSIYLLHDDSEHASHDHNHRAAFVHVLADALTSALAIVALLIGKHVGLVWLDPAMAIVGNLIILKWSFSLGSVAGCELLDVRLHEGAEDEVRSALERLDGVRVEDVHIWPIGQGRHAGVVTLADGQGRHVDFFRGLILSTHRLAHLTVELRDTEGTPAVSEPSATTGQHQHQKAHP